VNDNQPKRMQCYAALWRLVRRLRSDRTTSVPAEIVYNVRDESASEPRHPQARPRPRLACYWWLGADGRLACQWYIEGTTEHAVRTLSPPDEKLAA